MKNLIHLTVKKINQRQQNTRLEVEGNSLTLKKDTSQKQTIPNSHKQTSRTPQQHYEN